MTAESRTRAHRGLVATLLLLAAGLGVDGRQAEAHSGNPVDAAVAIPRPDAANMKGFLHRWSRYTRIDLRTGRADAGYPRSTCRGWNLPGGFNRRLDAAFRVDDKAYLFRGKRYLIYNLRTRRTWGPAPMRSSSARASWNLPPAFCRHIDAVLGLDGGAALFFKGAQCVQYDVRTETAGAPRPIADVFSVPPAFASGLDAAMNAGGGTAYLFRGTQCLCIDLATRTTRPGFPKPIAHVWPYAPGAQQPVELTVRITNVRHTTGKIRVALYDWPACWQQTMDSYRSAAHYSGREIDAAQARGGVLEIPISPVTPGTYGIVLQHDVNGNGRLDMRMKTFYGIAERQVPAEPYAFSRNFDPIARERKPAFRDVRIRVGGRGTNRVTIPLLRPR